MNYLFVSKKGGVGKSTIATTLAVYLHDLGRTVAALDADEQLHTARALNQAEPAIHVVALVDTNKIPQAIQKLAASYDDVVADAPANLSDESRALMVVADVAIFPMEPTIKSLQSTRESVQVLEYARAVTGGRPREAWLVLNKAKTRTRIFREIETLAPKLGLRVARSVIRDLQAFPEADLQGTVVTRMNTDLLTVQKAQEDIFAVFGEIVVTQQGKVANV
jgi:chromosome partitioning protein